MNSFIPWVGGKSKLLWIINKMAPDHYSRFIDVFGGSGTVTMSRPIQQGNPHQVWIPEPALSSGKY